MICFLSARKTPSKLLAGAIVIKRTSDENINPPKKPKLASEESEKVRGIIIHLYNVFMIKICLYEKLFI